MTHSEVEYILQKEKEKAFYGLRVFRSQACRGGEGEGLLRPILLRWLPDRTLQDIQCLSLNNLMVRGNTREHVVHFLV